MIPETDRREIERYLGYKGIHAADPQISAMIGLCMEDIRRESSPGAVCQTFPLVWEGEEACRFAGIRTVSRNLMRNLRGCEEVVLMAVTLGPGPDRLIRRAEVQNMLKACVYQAAGAAAVEAWCEDVNEKIRKEAEEKGLYTRPRFSPGYGDFPLEVQRDFERVLQMRKKIGIALTDSLLMTPTKSVTAVIGLSREKRPCHKQGCESCGMAGSCPFSRFRECEARRNPYQSQGQMLLTLTSYDPCGDGG